MARSDDVISSPIGNKRQKIERYNFILSISREIDFLQVKTYIKKLTEKFPLAGDFEH